MKGCRELRQPFLLARMTDNDIAELQKFSDSLRITQPDRIPPDLYPRIARCLACEEIDAQGAGFGARIAIAGKLSTLPFLTLESLGRTDPPFRNLLLAYLEHEPLLDGALENLLTRLRRAILMDAMAGARADGFGLDLIAALAIFCFGTEYIFTETDAEVRALGVLESRRTPAATALLGCYRPLARYPQHAALADNASRLFSKLITIQVTEPRTEAAIAPAIPALSSVTDATSRDVQSMYEENPYPRWKMLRPDSSVGDGAAHRSILIAGCGSGRHALLWARAYPAARILAMDLSRASLAYAIRKAREYQIGNVDFQHGDILTLPAQEMRFDLISCIGVLHHMARPQNGLNALAARLSTDGVIELGLYTESGRREVAAVEELRRQYSIPVTPDGIRYLRQMILSLPDTHPAKAARDGQDFYSMSGCRDYLLHVMEHRFTLAQVDAMLRDAGLRLTEIGAASEHRARFEKTFSDAADALQWHAYELQNPGCFGSMYDLRVVKR